MDKLKENLPRGYTTLLARRNNCTRQYVSKVITDQAITHPIYKQAVELARKHQKQINDIKKEIASL